MAGRDHQPRRRKLTLRDGTRGRAVLGLLTEYPDGLSTPRCAELNGEHPGQRELTWTGAVLRDAEAAGWVARAGKTPGRWGRAPAVIWAITAAGRKALARAGQPPPGPPPAPARERPRPLEHPWAGDAGKRTRAGESVASIARRHGVGRETVERALDRRGIPHGRAARPAWAGDAKTRYEAGEPAAALARRYRVSHSKVTSELRKQGVTIRTPQQASQARRAWQANHARPQGPGGRPALRPAETRQNAARLPPVQQNPQARAGEAPAWQPRQCAAHPLRAPGAAAPGDLVSTAVPGRGRPQVGRGPKPIGTGGPAPRDVDENLLVRRYVLARWPVAACARAAKITSKRARDILLAHDVQLREKPPLDEEEIIAAYQRQRSMQAVAVAFGTSDSKVSAILAAHGIQPAPRPRPLPLTPSMIEEPCARITLTEATRVLGRSSRAVKQAASDGLIRTGRGPHGATRYIRGDVEALAARLRAGETGFTLARQEPATPAAQPPAIPAPA